MSKLPDKSAKAQMEQYFKMPWSRIIKLKKKHESIHKKLLVIYDKVLMLEILILKDEFK
ncbi:MAG TPA: hypothetical protein VF974_08100 [Patescibacteria group bacterium]